MYDGVFPQTEKPHNFNVVYKKRKAELNSKQISLYFSIKYSMFGGVCFVPVIRKKAAEYISNQSRGLCPQSRFNLQRRGH